MKNTATVDLDIFNRALLQLQQVSGEVSHIKINPILQQFSASVIPPDEGKEKDALDRFKEHAQEMREQADKYAKEARKRADDYHADREAVNAAKKGDVCPSPTPQKNSSKKSGTSTR